jgi:hypothetical protein
MVDGQASFATALATMHTATICWSGQGGFHPMSDTIYFAKE